jgi:hypothetical protein
VLGCGGNVRDVDPLYTPPGPVEMITPAPTPITITRATPILPVSELSMLVGGGGSHGAAGGAKMLVLVSSQCPHSCRVPACKGADINDQGESKDAKGSKGIKALEACKGKFSLEVCKTLISVTPTPSLTNPVLAATPTAAPTNSVAPTPTPTAAPTAYLNDAQAYMGLGRLLHPGPTGFGFYLLSAENMKMMLHGDGETCTDRNKKFATVMAQQPKPKAGSVEEEGASPRPAPARETLCEAVLRQGDCNTGSMAHQNWVALNCAKSCALCTPVLPLRRRMAQQVAVNFLSFLPADTSCVVGTWSEWSNCPACAVDQVAVNLRHRTRKALVQPGSGGRRCPVLRMERKCPPC